MKKPLKAGMLSGGNIVILGRSAVESGSLPLGFVRYLTDAELEQLDLC